MRAEGSEGPMSNAERNAERTAKACAGMEEKLVEYLDGRAKPAERRAVEEHLAGCSGCRRRAEEFRALWGALDDLPVISPSPAFDAALRARIAAEPARRGFWGWLPSPRLAFAVTALVAMSVWMASMPRVTTDQTEMNRNLVEADFGMIRDLPVLENYDVLSKFDALTELSTPSNAPLSGEVTNETRE
jgi:ferric-dicitrate binding protein FerR (iron transport regulator)